MTDEQLMRAAIREAGKAEALGETPIGCVIAREGKIIARGYNRRMTDKQTLAHAELFALRKACKKAGDWRLEDCTLYVTLEPCPMCAGAIVQARIPRVVYGASNPKAGCAGSVLNLLNEPRFNHQAAVEAGLLGENVCGSHAGFFSHIAGEKNAPHRQRARKERKKRSKKTEFPDNISLKLQNTAEKIAKLSELYYT